MFLTLKSTYYSNTTDTAGFYEWQIGYCNGSSLQPVFGEGEGMLWIMMPFSMSGEAEGGCSLWARSKSNTSGWLTLARPRLSRFRFAAVCCGKAYHTKRVESLTLPLHSQVCFTHTDVCTKRDTVNILVHYMHMYVQIWRRYYQLF